MSFLRKQTRSLGLALTAALWACRSPEAAPLEEQRLLAAVQDRESDRQALSEALGLVDLEGLGLPSRERLEGAPADDAEAAFQSLALGLAPELRQARRRFRAAAARARSAGAPGPLGVEGEIEDLRDLDQGRQVKATFDLLGILGLGRKAAAADLGAAEARRAFSDLELAARAALYAVERSRIRLAAADRRLRKLDELRDEIASDLRRIELLETRGFVEPVPASRTRAVAAAIRERCMTLEAELVRARSELSRACGLPPDAARLRDPALDPATRSGDPVAIGAEIPLPQLVAQHPEMRAARLEYALAEAELRAAVAASWPDLRIGSRLAIGPDRLVPGGLLSLEFPWPGSEDGNIDAALENRERARENAEDLLLGLRARVVAAAARWREAVAIARTAAPERESRSAAAFAGARARFAVDAEGIGMLVEALMMRAEGTLAVIDADESAALAHIDYAEAAALALPTWRMAP